MRFSRVIYHRQEHRDVSLGSLALPGNRQNDFRWGAVMASHWKLSEVVLHCPQVLVLMNYMVFGGPWKGRLNVNEIGNLEKLSLPKHNKTQQSTNHGRWVYNLCQKSTAQKLSYQWSHVPMQKFIPSCTLQDSVYSLIRQVYLGYVRFQERSW